MELYISLSMFVLLLLVLVVVMIALQKRLKALQCQLQQQQNQVRNLDQQLQMLADGTFGLGEQLAGVKKGISSRESVPQDNSPTGDISLRQAIELARKGATVDELIDICGLARGEAELLSTMHNQTGS